MNFQFGNIVVVDDDQIGVIVKLWEDGACDVYVRNYNLVREYDIKKIKHYVYNKELLPDEYEFYIND